MPQTTTEGDTKYVSHLFLDVEHRNPTISYVQVCTVSTLSAQSITISLLWVSKALLSDVQTFHKGMSVMHTILRLPTQNANSNESTLY